MTAALKTGDTYKGRTVVFAPQAGPQELFVCTTVNEVLYGGAAGGGKSYALVAIPLRFVGNGNFRALILRRETTQLGQLLDNAQKIYKPALPGADYKGDTHTWKFPSGATVRFNHCKDEADAYDYQGSEFQVLGFDEITHFTEKQYREICSRLRSADPTLPRYIRATGNPGGPGHEWVLKHWGAWLDPEFEAPGLPKSTRFDADGNRLPPLPPGKAAWISYDSKGREVYVEKGTPGARSRTFIPAKLSDNPALMAGDPDYGESLKGLDPIRRAQLLDGNWLAKPAAGHYFKREWFKKVDAAPADARRIRYWDRAASEPSESYPDPDWTRGVRLAEKDGIYYVEHVASIRARPAGVESLIKETAADDGGSVAIGIEQDPSSAGKMEGEYYVRLLRDYEVRAYPVSGRGQKTTRAAPVSSQAEAGNIKLVRGAWNEDFLNELEAFPCSDEHDDIVDALSGAYAALNSLPPAEDFKPHRVPSRSGRGRWR